MWFDYFNTDNNERKSTKASFINSLQASTWDDALPVLQGIPNLVLTEQLQVLFCELYDLIRMHRRLAPNVSNTSLNGMLDDMNAYLSANVINALRAHVQTLFAARRRSMTRSYVSS